MVAYGDTATIANMLKSSTTDGFSGALTDRIEQLREVVSRQLDRKLGRTFGVVGVPSMRVLTRRYGSDTLFLPVPARTVESVTSSLVVEGGVPSGGYLLDDASWTVGLRDDEGNAVTLLTAGYWSGYVGVTAVWADESTTTEIPAEIDWATNYLVMRSIQTEQTSIAGVSNELGLVTPPIDAWSNPIVRNVVDGYRLITERLVL